MQNVSSSQNLVNRLQIMLSLKVGGLIPLTTIDFPDRLSAVVFCQGCPWRCVYCHNPHLIPANGPPALTWEEVLSFLDCRRGLLDGVVFSGGEPTLQSALPQAMRDVRDMGFEVALHTAGMYPDRLATVLPLLDWVGLDLKAPASCHDAIVGAPKGYERVMASLDLILACGVDYECRTTWTPELYGTEELADLAQELARKDVSHWSHQILRPASPRYDSNAGRTSGFLTGM